MLTAWDVYWVMQLDSIGAVAMCVAFVVSGLAAFASLWALAARGDCDPEAWYSPEYKAKALRNQSLWPRLFARARQLGLVAACLWTLSAFIPSTKTAAAMVVLPAIANNETIHREAGELYDLAKRALSEAVGGKPAK